MFIDHLKGIKNATNWLNKNRKSNSVISVITRAELLVGALPEEKYFITSLLDTFRTLSIDVKTANVAAQMRRKYKLKLPDTFQAALAKTNGLKLVTRNTKDFSAQMKFVEIPYKL